MELQLSILLNVFLYVIIGILCYRLIIVVDDELHPIPETERQQYFGFMLIMCCVWPVIFGVYFFTPYEELPGEEEPEK